jgi:tetratricopeptide (TPR) repeat protein
MGLATAAPCTLIMRCLIMLSGLTLFLVTDITPAATQQSDLNGSLRRFNDSYNAGNYAAALVEAQKLEAGAKARLGVAHPDYGSALYNLGLVYAAQGKYAQAEEAYKHALEIKEKVFGAEHPKVAWTLNNLAIVYVAQGKHAEAEVLYKRALAIRQKELGANHPDLAMILGNVALVFYEQGNTPTPPSLPNGYLSSRRRRSAQTIWM